MFAPNSAVRPYFAHKKEDEDSKKFGFSIFSLKSSVVL